MGLLVFNIPATATSSPSQELLKSVGNSEAKGSVDAVSSASEKEELKCLLTCSTTCCCLCGLGLDFENGFDLAPGSNITGF